MPRSRPSPGDGLSRRRRRRPRTLGIGRALLKLHRPKRKTPGRRSVTGVWEGDRTAVFGSVAGSAAVRHPPSGQRVAGRSSLSGGPFAMTTP